MVYCTAVFTYILLSHYVNVVYTTQFFYSSALATLELLMIILYTAYCMCQIFQRIIFIRLILFAVCTN